VFAKAVRKDRFRFRRQVARQAGELNHCSTCEIHP
jgi:hypothetical protein